MAVIALVIFGGLGYLLNQERGAEAGEVKRFELDSSTLAGSAARTIAGAGDQAPAVKTDALRLPRQVAVKEPAHSDSSNGHKSGTDLGVKAVPGPSLAVVPVKNDLTPTTGAALDRTQREVRGIYSDWAMAAIRGDWAKHMSYYAEKIEYFSNGLLRRSAVELRKRRIFGGLDSYALRFSQSPQVSLKNSSGDQEADVIFSRYWELRRGKKRVKGEARGLIILRRDSHGWRIISERQIK
jgi:hypothetical protein